MGVSGAVPQGDDHDATQEFIGEPPLDTAQQLRIRATHRGFTYQNLYAVGCLLRLRDAGAESLLVERDEDLEVVLPGRRLYLQVKTRKSGVLVWSDIRDALDQYRGVRAEHDADRRSGSPSLILITNAQPGPDLLDRTVAVDWPSDVHLLYPGRPSEAEAWLPTPAPDLEAMMQWCTAEASNVRFASLKPRTLVEKLAARVQYASTGALGQGFAAADLAQLFEQFVQELQAFPEIPDTYRPQKTDPELVGEQPVRLVVGYSGAGKTTWAADAAKRCSLPVTYCDVADGVSADALAESLARELAARHLSGPAGTELPYGSSLDVLRAVHRRLEEAGIIVAVVLDNAHRVPVDGLRALIAALPTAQLILLAHPWPEQPVLETHLGIAPQVLPGWSVDTVVELFAAEGCRTDYATAQRVITLTGGLPLYVGQAAVLARSQYGADVAEFCDAFGEGTHAMLTAQERILERAFAGLGETATALAGLLALAEVPLKQDELQLLAADMGLASRSVNGRALRELVGPGLTQSFGDGHLKLHDAARPVAPQVLEGLDEETADRVQRTLCQIVEGDWDPARRSRWMRLLGSTGQIGVLIALTEEEGFFERDYPREVRTDLADTARDPASDPALRLDAHNALAAWAFNERDMEALASHVHAMETIHRAGHPDFGPREAVLVASRQFRLYGPAGALTQLRRAFAEAQAQTPAPSRFGRGLRYEYAGALWEVGEYLEAGKLAAGLTDTYMDHLGLTPPDILLPVEVLHERCVSHATPDDFKRLADCFGLLVKVARKLGRMDFEPWALWAFKLYNASGATRSAIDSGQDLADVECWTNPAGALKQLDSLLRAAQENNLLDMIVGIRSQRAFVLALAGDVPGARAEMEALARYDLTPSEIDDIRHQSQLIEEIANPSPR